MAEEKTENKNGKTIVVSRKLIAVVIILIVIGIGIFAFNFFNSKKNVEYIASDSPILGSNSAAIFVIEFSDYECPFCQASEGANQEIITQLKQNDPSWEAPVPNIITQYVNTGKVKLVFRNFPVHGNNNPAIAAKCAQEQGKFWEFHQTLFQNYNAIEITDLKKYAADLGLNLTQFNECLDSKKYESSIQNDLSDGQGLGVSGTPTFFIGNNETGYDKIEGAQSFSVFKQLINSKL